MNTEWSPIQDNSSAEPLSNVDESYSLKHFYLYISQNLIDTFLYIHVPQNNQFSHPEKQLQYSLIWKWNQFCSLRKQQNKDCNTESQWGWDCYITTLSLDNKVLQWGC